MALILVAEDQPSQQTLIRINLVNEGHEVIATASGAEALQQAAVLQPQLILLNILLPDIGGLDVLAKLKKMKHLQGSPIIVLTSREGNEDITTALDLGAQDYVANPLNMAVLNARVRSALRISEAQQALRDANQKLAEMASHDGLTHLYNRRVLMERMEEEVNKARRTRRALSLVMIDADHFKGINDHYGHPAGDRVLCDLATIIQQTVRQMDIPARIGGEEFAILCPETDLEGARLLAERLREKIAASSVHAGPHHIRYSASFGVALLTAKDQDTTAWLSRCDDLLYQAKAEGRNKVVSGESLAKTA